MATAVVLAAGRGRRLRDSDGGTLPTEAQREAARAGLKALMPVGPGTGRPLIDFVLHVLADAGVADAVLVVPPDHAALERHLAALAPKRLRVQLAVQTTPTGTAGAVAAAAEHVEASRFLVINGDNLYPVDAIRGLTHLDTCALAAFTRASLERESGFSPTRVAAFAAVERDRDGWLAGMQEKPPVGAMGPETLVSMNLWWMDQTLFEACHDVPPSARGERELPDAVMLAVSRGTPFRVVEACGVVLDLTTADDVSRVSGALGDVEPQP